MHNLVEIAGRKVKNISIQLTNADNELDGVSQRVLLDNAPCAEEGHGTPEDSGDGFHRNQE